MTASSERVGFSLARGGFFYAILRRLRLARNDGRDIRRDTVALLVVGWGTLAIIAGVEVVLGVRPAWLLRDPSVHVRLLLALPLFLYAEDSLDRRCGHALDQFVAGGFCPELDAVEHIIRSARRLRDSWWPELILLGVAIILSQRSFWGPGSTGLVRGWASAAGQLSVTHIWYAFVCLPLYQFLLLRIVWRWFIWSRLLWQLSRLPLRLVPTHPDLAGGLAELARPITGLAIAIAAASAVIASAWGGQIVAGRTALRSLTVPFAVLVVLCELVAIGPLLVFTRHLLRGRMEGLRQYSAFALRYTRDFHHRWITHSGQPEEQLLGTSDIQSLADLSNSFKIVQSMRLVPFPPRALYVVLVATVLPMLPLLLSEMSVWEIAARLGRALLGGRAG